MTTPATPLYDYILDCSVDFEPDVATQQKATATGRYVAAAGITGIDMRLSATQGGGAIHASLADRGTLERSGEPGTIYPATAFDVADLQSHVLPAYRGRVIYLVLSKAGVVVGKSLTCFVTSNGT